MMLAETCIIGGTMDGYSHLSIAEREDIMVRWKGHEGVSQIARELHRDKSTISRECFLSIRSDQKYHQELNIPMICFCTSRSRDMASLRT